MDIQEPQPDMPSGAVGTQPPGCWTALAALAAGALLAGLAGFLGSRLTGRQGILLLVGELCVFAGTLAYLLVRGHDLRASIRARYVPRSVLWPALQLGLALLLANLAASSLFGPWEQASGLGIESMELAERIALAVTIGLVAPVAEEALFRGLIQGVLEREIGPWPAIVAAAVPFAALHGFPGPAVFILVWSVPIGWVAWRTRSILPGVLVHGVNNAIGAVIVLGGGSLDAEPGVQEPSGIALGVIFLMLGGGWAVAMCRQIDRAGGVEQVEPGAGG